MNWFDFNDENNNVNACVNFYETNNLRKLSTKWVRYFAAIKNRNDFMWNPNSDTAFVREST